mgnify:FL=1
MKKLWLKFKKGWVCYFDFLHNTPYGQIISKMQTVIIFM